MADKTIRELPDLSNLDNSDIIPVVKDSDGSTNKVYLSTLKSYIGSGGSTNAYQSINNSFPRNGDTTINQMVEFVKADGTKTNVVAPLPVHTIVITLDDGANALETLELGQSLLGVAADGMGAASLSSFNVSSITGEIMGCPAPISIRLSITGNSGRFDVVCWDYGYYVFCVPQAPDGTTTKLKYFKLEAVYDTTVNNQVKVTRIQGAEGGSIGSAAHPAYPRNRGSQIDQFIEYKNGDGSGGIMLAPLPVDTWNITLDSSSIGLLSLDVGDTTYGSIAPIDYATTHTDDFDFGDALGEIIAGTPAPVNMRLSISGTSCKTDTLCWDSGRVIFCSPTQMGPSIAMMRYYMLELDDSTETGGTNRVKITRIAGTQEGATISYVDDEIARVKSEIPEVVDTYSSTGVDAVSGKAVAEALATLPEPMIFKGSLGTGGTVTSLPTASSSNKGYTYKVITAGTYAGQAAKIGDTFISDGSAWVLIPSGDEPSGTVTSVGMTVPTGLSVSGSPVTSSGTLAVNFEAGYSIPSDEKQSEWDAAYEYSQIGHVPTTRKINGKELSSDITLVAGDISGLATVATTGDINDLDSVNITNPTDGQVLAYDSENEEWINTTGGGGIPWTDITATLEAGETTLTISNQAITTTSTIDIYTDTFGVAPTNQVVTSGQIVLTFESQSNNIGVKVRVS